MVVFGLSLIFFFMVVVVICFVGLSCSIKFLKLFIFFVIRLNLLVVIFFFCNRCYKLLLFCVIVFFWSLIVVLRLICKEFKVVCFLLFKEIIILFLNWLLVLFSGKIGNVV